MIHDAQEMDRSLFDRTFDVCVIGAGPAGITLARSLARNGFDIALMEGGDIDLTDESQSLYEGEVEGLDNYELDVSRLRMLGGSSNHWNGRCRPLEAFDFFERSYNPLSGWPISRENLDPYGAEAAEIIDLTPELLPDVPVEGGGGTFRQVFWQRSAPTRFGSKYHDEIAAAPNIALCLNANLVDLRLAGGGRAVESALFKSYAVGDPGFTVRAKRYCLCLGGIENARALLNADGQAPGGIGNAHDLVGRYFQDHVAIEVADIMLGQPLPNAATEVSYAPTLDYQNEIEGLAMVFVISPRPVRNLSLPHALVRAAECLTPFTERLFEHVRHETLKCRGTGFAEFHVQRDPEHYPSGLIWAQTEQPLMSDCRVMLNEERDSFGLRRATLDWLLDDHYYATLRAATLQLGTVLADEGVGRLKPRNWLLEDKPVLPRRAENTGEVASRHHMGTTRMAIDPARGVVDTDCRVHGMSNLYIGGSSVFPTGGFANPTYTIVQMTLRLGQHLARELSA